MKLYCYVGPPEIRAAFLNEAASSITARQQVNTPDDVRAWWAEQNPSDTSPALTFVVDESGCLWIADRHSEHVVCARGGRVRAAGEITFELEPHVRVSEVTNQSTGYCPEPASYEALASALERIGLSHPGDYTPPFEFRRCESCNLLNVIKDEDWFCVACLTPLSAVWNCDSEAA